jgi:ribosomal protein S18 acetylase RimI-like enzyme
MPPRVSSFSVERRPTPLSPPAVVPGGPFRPSQALLEALAALDAHSRGDQATPPSAPEFLSRALGGGARRADVFVARCGGSDDGGDDGDGNDDGNDGCSCCGYLVSRRLGRSLAAARISALGVREGCRRRGVATALVGACAAAAAAAASTAAAAADGSDKKGPVVLTLSVARGNAAARALYARLGFKARRRREEGPQLEEEEEEEEMEALFADATDDAATKHAAAANFFSFEEPT